MSLLRLENVSVDYPRRHASPVRAVADVSLEIPVGTIVGLVGETGCGKSSLGRAAVGIVRPAAGRVLFEGRDVVPLASGVRPEWLRRLQMVFQDPGGSLNPRRTVGTQLAEAAALSRGASNLDRGELLERVGLSASAATRYPHEFSGGQRQRLAIARVLACEPRCIVADEPISSLDVSAQRQISQLLVELVRELGMGMLFISHDVAVVQEICDVTAVMYLGKIVEVGPTERVWARPQHPYTRALVAAVPQTDELGVLPTELEGDVPDPAEPPAGCRFHPRCPIAFARCRLEEPQLERVADVQVACFAAHAPNVHYSVPDATEVEV